MTNLRAERRKMFLGNLQVLHTSKLPADASPRKYERLYTNQGSYILMDYDPQHGELKPFIQVAALLADIGISVPKIFQQDLEYGFLLLEDLGDLTINKLLNQVSRNQHSEVYRKIIELLLYLQRQQLTSSTLPHLTNSLLSNQLILFTEWYWPFVTGRPMPSDLYIDFFVIWRKLLNSIPQGPLNMILGDFHVDNLMHLPERVGIQAIGVLDFQDAKFGNAIYDLVFLLDDARREVSPELKTGLLYYYAQSRTDMSPSDILFTYDTLAAQNNMRILGLFARKSMRDKIDNYLSLAPRIVSYLKKNLQNPHLVHLSKFLPQPL